MNVYCDDRNCNHNTGFRECMWGVTKNLVEKIRTNPEGVCPHLRECAKEWEEAFENASTESK